MRHLHLGKRKILTAAAFASRKAVKHESETHLGKTADSAFLSINNCGCCCCRDNQKPSEQQRLRQPRVRAGNPWTSFAMQTAQPRAGKALATRNEYGKKSGQVHGFTQTNSEEKTAFKVFQIKHKHEYVDTSLKRKKKKASWKRYCQIDSLGTSLKY